MLVSNRMFYLSTIYIYIYLSFSSVEILESIEQLSPRVFQVIFLPMIKFFVFGLVSLG